MFSKALFATLAISADATALAKCSTMFIDKGATAVSGKTECANAGETVAASAECAAGTCDASTDLAGCCSVPVLCSTKFIDKGATAVAGKTECANAGEKASATLKCATATCKTAAGGEDLASCCAVPATTTVASNTTNGTSDNAVTASIAGAAVVSAAALVFA